MLHLNCTALSQSDLSNFFMYIIIVIIIIIIIIIIIVIVIVIIIIIITFTVTILSWLVNKAYIHPRISYFDYFTTKKYTLKFELYSNICQYYWYGIQSILVTLSIYMLWTLQIIINFAVRKSKSLQQQQQLYCTYIT